MDSILLSLSDTIEKFGPGIFIPIGLLIAVGVMAQWALYDKCGLPGIACIVPFWNVTTFLKIMGRPWWHIFFFLIPVYNIYFTIRIYIELCHCFGKRQFIDYLLVILFNGFYILNLGLSYKVKYLGPVYGQDKVQKESSKVVSGEVPVSVA